MIYPLSSVLLRLLQIRHTGVTRRRNGRKGRSEVRHFWLTLCAIPVVTAAMAATAQTTPGTASGETLIEAVTQCRAIADSAGRLACFDRASSALETARADNGLAVLSREEVADKRRSLFGFQLPTINLFGRSGEKMPEIQNLESSVSTVTRSGRDRWLVRLADGSTWKTTEPARFPPRIGDSVKIKRAALGTFVASFDGDRSLRIERVQ